MSSRFILTPLAQRDMDQIADYTIALWGKKKAKSYVAEIISAIKMLTHNPDLGRDCGSILKGHRKYSIGSHVLFFCPLADGIKITRILHRNIQAENYL